MISFSPRGLSSTGAAPATIRHGDRQRGLSVEVRAPAKINPILRVVGVRADGYHLLESLMIPVGLYDRVKLRSIPDQVRLICSDPSLPADEANLAWRAAEHMRRWARVSAGVEIRLAKRIPAGAGLGGGSSDAAAVLRGLNQLWSLGLPTSELARVGATLGADVPFFVYGRPAAVRGIGERVRPLSSIQPWHLVLLWPGFPISTRWVYENLRHRPGAVPGPSLSHILRRPDDIPRSLCNDLEPVAVEAHPALRALGSRLLAAGAVGVGMSGSGSAWFGIFPSGTSARRAARRLACPGMWSMAIDSISATPEPRVRRT